MEIRNYHIACIVKIAGKKELSALEVYHFNSIETDWYSIFQGIKLKSKILNRGFIDTRVYFNLPECVLIPTQFFTENAAANYLQLMHGDTINQVIKTEAVNVDPSLTLAVKIKRSLMDAINSNLMMITTHNTFKVFIENLLSTERPYNHTLMKAQIYNGEILIGLVHNKQLLLVQLYNQNSPEDVLYHLLNALQQYGIKPEETTFEISGMLEIKTALYENLKKVFPRLTFDLADESLTVLHDFTKYAQHYLTPYLMLF
jgi:hypothetical protein